MGVQLIFVVETNKKCNSDWIYIKDTIEHFYNYDRTQLKLSAVYMDGKGNYRSKKKEREINSLISQYSITSKNNCSMVLYCFDCDDYDSNVADLNFLEEVRQYCRKQCYEFIWFCKYVEEVYLGKRINDSQKKKEAANFKEKKIIVNINAKQLSKEKYGIGTSNIMNILDRCPGLVRKIS